LLKPSPEIPANEITAHRMTTVGGIVLPTIEHLMEFIAISPGLLTSARKVDAAKKTC